MEPSDPSPTSTAGDTPASDSPPSVAPASDGRPAAQRGLGVRKSAGVVASARHSNLRRATHLGKLMALTLLAYLLVLIAVASWFHHRLMAGIDARIESVRGTIPPSPVPVADPSASATATSAELARLNDARDADKGEMKAALDALSRRLADTEEQNRRQTARLEELTAALSAAKAALEERKAAPVTSVAVAPPLPAGGGLPPTQGELLLLKERNRLAGYADEAISTGARAPYEKLWEALDDPRLANLVHAARAEILRVQNYYLGGSRIDRFDIPVATYFPDDGELRDIQLKDAQLIKLLRDQKNPWEVRMKAANLLTTRRSLETGDALVEAVKKDQNLDVVKEATFSFESMTGVRARIFDAASMEKWWKQYKATPTPSKPKSRAANAKAPEPAAATPAPAPAPQNKDGKKKS